MSAPGRASCNCAAQKHPAAPAPTIAILILFLGNGLYNGSNGFCHRLDNRSRRLNCRLGNHDWLCGSNFGLRNNCRLLGNNHRLGCYDRSDVGCW